MSSLSFAPAPGSAPLPRMVRAHATMELRLLARNGEQVLLALAIPVLVLLGGAESRGVVTFGEGRRIDVLTPGVFALAVIGTSFTSLAIATGFERRYDVLKRLGTTPLGRTGLLTGKVLALLCVELAQVVVIGAVALALGWHPNPGIAGACWAALLAVVATAAFAALGLLLAGTLRAEATLAGANLVYIVLLVAGAVVVPLSSYPSGMRDVVTLLPSGALAEGLREAFEGRALSGWHLVVLACWALVAALTARRYFRWE